MVLLDLVLYVHAFNNAWHTVGAQEMLTGGLKDPFPPPAFIPHPSDCPAALDFIPSDPSPRHIHVLTNLRCVLPSPAGMLTGP